MLNKKKKIQKEIKLWVLLVVACLLRAFSIYAFVLPNNFAPGGITGIATMINYGIDAPVLSWISNTSLFLFLLNIPMVIVSYFAFNRNYAIKTTVAMFLVSGFMILVEELEGITGTSFAYVQNSESKQPILAAISAGVFNGVALAMILNAGGSNGGTDVLGGIFAQKLPHINASWFITVLDAVVILFSFFVFKGAYESRFTPIILALINSFCMSKVCDTLMHGFKKATKFDVITPHPDEVSQDLIKVLGRTVTKMDAEGMYTHQKKGYLICVVRNRQIPLFYDVLKKYPDTFAYLTATTEVIGKGFTRVMHNVKIDLEPIKAVDKKLDITKFVDDDDTNG